MANCQMTQLEGTPLQEHKTVQNENKDGATATKKQKREVQQNSWQQRRTQETNNKQHLQSNDNGICSQMQNDKMHKTVQ